LIAIALPSFALLYAMDDVGEPTLTIKVVGHQWYWSYEVVTMEEAMGAMFGPLTEAETLRLQVNQAIDDDLGITALNEAVGTGDVLTKKAFDSYMVLEEDLLPGQHRLLETDNTLLLPSWTQIRFLITSDDVIHS
jgi:cytochrome c oxidase subunit 2